MQAPNINQALAPAKMMFENVMQIPMKLPSLVSGGQAAMNNGMSSFQNTAAKMQQAFTQPLNSFFASFGQMGQLPMPQGLFPGMPAAAPANATEVAIQGGEIVGEAADTSKHSGVRTTIF
jgi:hypothetical protein|tara:strand:+ start:3786 stop:4145 length:360 start_codon:yes stop_codon:yes gene_type:complete